MRDGDKSDGMMVQTSNVEQSQRSSVELMCQPLPSCPVTGHTTPTYIELSLADYIKEHPKYKHSLITQTLFSLAKLFHCSSFIQNYVITAEDYQGLVEKAKRTKFGLLVLTIGEQKVVFTANPSVQDQLVGLETGSVNKFTSRQLHTDDNRRLLENNPVAANELDHQINYVEEQRRFFSDIAADKDFNCYIDNLFPQNTQTRIKLTEHEATTIVGEYFTQLYFQALFSNSNTGFINETIAANVKKHYQEICKLYAEIEKCTGKYGLTFGKFQSSPASNNSSDNTGDSKLIPLLYHVICHIYGHNSSLNDEDTEETISKKIILLMKENNARVLPVFNKLSDDTKTCFNLLSWLDNSLNIINTLSNYVAHIHDNKSEQEQNQLISEHIIDLLPKVRALSTLFMRKINPKATVSLRFEGFEEVINMDENYRVVMTNSMPGVVFGANPRKCPSRDFSHKLIPIFICNFFRHYAVDFSQNLQSISQTQSWFWNIIYSEGNKTDILRKGLEHYITEVKKHSSNGKTFNYGFWHHGQSRAVNRKGNYLLAQALKDMLEETGSLDGIYGEYNGKTISQETHKLEDALLIYREALMRKDDSLKADPYFNKAIGRGINSQTLNHCLSNFMR